MPVTAAVIGGGAALGGGLLGANSAAKGRKAAAAAAAAAMAQLTAIGMPPDMSKEIILRQYQSAGTLTPELLQDIELQDSNVGQISEDPSLKAAQMESLQTLGQVSRGGLRPEDRAAYNELRANTQRDAQAKRQQVLQSMQARGMGGSGADLIAQLGAGQAAEDQASSQGDRLAAQASQNALQALNQRAALAGNVRGQDFSNAQAKAQALDERNKFLYQNSASRQAANAAAQNQAQAANLSNAQNLANTNTSQANAESLRQNEAKRTYYNDQLNLAQAKANALNNQASTAVQSANQQANMYSGMGNAVANAAGAIGSAYGKKTDNGGLTDEQIAGRKAEANYKF